MLLFFLATSSAVYADDVRFSPETRQQVQELLRAQVGQEANQADVSFNLALELLETGTQPEEMFSLMYKAAELGKTSAYAYLAAMYNEGLGVQKDLVKSAEWMHRAAMTGVVDAMVQLSIKYNIGEGVEQDIKKAKFWCRTAIEHDASCAEAHSSLAVYLLTHEPTDAQKAEAESLMQRAAELGDVDAMCFLASEYSCEDGAFPRNLPKAFQFWHSAANREVERAYMPLGECYLYGRGTERDIQSGMEYVEWAAAADMADAQRFLALEYGDAKGFYPLDSRLAVEWGTKALKHAPDDAELHCLVGDHILRQNRNSASARKRAYAHYSEAVIQKNPRAIYMQGRAWECGWAYEQGRRQKADPDKAAQYYWLAMSLGSPEAGAALIRMANLGYIGLDWDMETLLKALKRASDAGVKGCAAMLAVYYHPDAGEQPDAEIAAQWMKVAVERDETLLAMVLRACSLMEEHEAAAAPEKLREAEHLLRRAAAQGCAAGYSGLGTLHIMEGSPLPYDAGKAIELCRKAARMGDSVGAEVIADMCAEGEGVEKDWWLARKWRRYARSIEYQQRNKKSSLIQLED